MTDPLGTPAPLVSTAGLAGVPSRANSSSRNRLKYGLAAVTLVSLLGLAGWWMSRGEAPKIPTVAARVDNEAGTFPELPGLRSYTGPHVETPLEPTLSAVRRATLLLDEEEARPVLDPDRAARWEVRFPAGGSAETYARQLDDFGIELGILGGSSQIGYLSKLSAAEPIRRVGPATDEKRLYMTWRDGTLREVDIKLLTRIGVKLQGKILAHFYPPAVEAELARLEQQFCEPRSMREIRRTVFTVRPAANGFSFLIGEQQYFDGDIKRPSAGGESRPAGKQPLTRPAAKTVESEPTDAAKPKPVVNDVTKPAVPVERR